jgi:prepilin signal peptidase PulO-like enzyme (type II secretory pathway)
MDGSFWAVVSAVFGLVVGSFLNVVINRLRLKQSLGGRSHCPHCKHELNALDLVPLFSFLFLGGKCRYCGKPISWQYPAVEAFTGLAFMLAWLKFQAFGADLAFVWILAAFFIVIAVYDLKHYLILDKVVFPGLAVAVAYALYRDFSGGCGLAWNCATISGLLGAAVVAGFFYLQHLVSGGRWIGFGDVKFGLMLGFAAGFPLCILLLFISYTAGASVGMALLATGSKQATSKMPFGTFLALGAIATLLYGQPIMNWYLDLIGFSTI